MSATLRLTHKAIGAEVRRGTLDVLVDTERVGSVEMNDTIEMPVQPGRHTLQIRNGRNSSRTVTFDAVEGEVVAFRCTGKRLLPVFLASFVIPSLALVLHREQWSPELEGGALVRVGHWSNHGSGGLVINHG